MSTPFDPQPTTLTGESVILEPLQSRHAPGLFEAGSDASIWRYMPNKPWGTIKDAEAWIASSAERATAGTELPFATIHRQTNRVVGSTRYLNIQRPHRSLEIGYTWLSPSHQRTTVNTECKYLLLQYAFEQLDALRVQFKTDLRNKKSQTAIERIGAKHEGILRNHMILWNGHVRDSVYYSVIAEEWPDVRKHLLKMLSASPN